MVGWLTEGQGDCAFACLVDMLAYINKIKCLHTYFVKKCVCVFAYIQFFDYTFFLPLRKEKPSTQQGNTELFDLLPNTPVCMKTWVMN